jgi:hypothetical protein
MTDTPCPAEAGIKPLHNPELLMQLLRRTQPHDEIQLATPDGARWHEDTAGSLDGWLEDQWYRSQSILFRPAGQGQVIRDLYVVVPSAKRQQLLDFPIPISHGWDDGEKAVGVWSLSMPVPMPVQPKGYGAPGLPKPMPSPFVYNETLADAELHWAWLRKQFDAEHCELVPAPGSYNFRTGKIAEYFAFDESIPHALLWFQDLPLMEKDKLFVPEKGLACTRQNIEKVLHDLDIELRRDLFACREVISGMRGFPVLNDAAVNRLRFIAESQYQMRGKKDYWFDAVSDIALYNSFHPVCDYLKEQQELYPWEDGAEICETWLIDCAGAPNTPFVRAISRIWSVAAVRRVRKPGCKFDEMLVLESEQGLNKSSALKMLAVKDDWFLDSLPLGKASREMQEALAGKWIVEFAELDGLSPEKDLTIKAQLSRTHDKARAVFTRKTDDQARQCVFAGTVNPSGGYLTDPTGNRRYWPVAVQHFDLEKLAAIRDRLWAEAAHREARGESIRLDPSLYAAAAAEQAQRVAADPWEERIAARLGDLKGIMRTSIVWNLLEIPVGQLTQKHGARVGGIMRKLGCVHGQKKVNGKVIQVYRRGFEDNTTAQPGEDKLWITTDYDRSTGRLLIIGGELPLPKAVDESGQQGELPMSKEKAPF